jgi:hypothetical protein
LTTDRDHVERKDTKVPKNAQTPRSQIIEIYGGNRETKGGLLPRDNRFYLDVHEHAGIVKLSCAGERDIQIRTRFWFPQQDEVCLHPFRYPPGDMDSRRTPAMNTI